MILTLPQVQKIKKQKKVSSDSYKANSPWTHYYAEMIANFKSFDESNKLVNNLETNMFFRPDLFKLITDQLYLTPVWNVYCVTFKGK